MAQRTPPETSPSTRLSRSIRRRHDVTLSRREVGLWILVVGALVADLALTAEGIQQGYTEANPFAREVMAIGGMVGFALLKGVAVVFAGVVRLLVPERYATLVPATLFVPWGTAAVVNLFILVLT